MQNTIISVIGVLIAVVCAVAGWWMENGPVRKDPDEKKREKENQL